MHQLPVSWARPPSHPGAKCLVEFGELFVLEGLVCGALKCFGFSDLGVVVIEVGIGYGFSGRFEMVFYGVLLSLLVFGKEEAVGTEGGCGIRYHIWIM